MQFPTNPLSAVTHPDPYPYYRQLTLEKPLTFDPGLKLWIASSAETIQELMAHRHCQVRPASEPVPEHLLDSPAAVLYSNFVRMQDGDQQKKLKAALDSALVSLVALNLERECQHWVRHDFATLDDLMFQLPVFVVGGLLGIPADRLPQTAAWIHDFVQCLPVPSSRPQQTLGKKAAGHLLESLRDLNIPGLGSGLAVTANAIGFMVQAFEATAGLIGNSLVALAGDHDLRMQVIDRPELIGPTLSEVLRHDPPIQNTRRFVNADCRVAGHDLLGGDSILLILAAANRDPSIHPNPDQFDIHRAQQPQLSFGQGAHRCPGRLLAQSIAEAGLGKILLSDLSIESLAGPISYRPSVNARIPIFAGKLEESTR